MERLFTSKSIQPITLIGPESTGKTTLCEILAPRYNTVYVPEYLREYSQKKWDEEQKPCSWEDMPLVLKGQLKGEEKYNSLANKFIFLDTNPLTLYIYSHIYFQKAPEEIIQACLNRPSNEYYLLTDVDVPWEFDVLRDRPNDREYIFDLMQQELLRRKLPFSIISGTIPERINKIDELLAKF
ncbi:AAA family ATPase [Neisseriaceae bacterium PsAf]|nr:AAA family ATPase [Neisseriaceae bacterium PsAf]MCV2503257.1 ATP-binding protein [Neisseriaceae bacterium]